MYLVNKNQPRSFMNKLFIKSLVRDKEEKNE
jgi:hypothetical protein